MKCKRIPGQTISTAFQVRYLIQNFLAYIFLTNQFEAELVGAKAAEHQLSRSYLGAISESDTDSFAIFMITLSTSCMKE